jgi:two-component system, probable response regulator PhcQ
MTFTIMLVDDDANLVEGLQRTLHKEQYRILACTNAEKALQRLASESVDVLVSDEQMPGMNGAEFLAAVNRDYPQIVSIMLSGQASMGSLIHAVNHGRLFRFLIKPCNGEDLIAAIRQALSHKRLLDSCAQVLPLVRRQTSLLVAIERRHPGICRSIEAESGMTARLTPEPHHLIEELTEHLDVEIRQGGKVLGN